MSPLAKSTKATVIPCLRYRDAPAAIEWLCRAFGFEKQLVVPNKDGMAAHAQLSFGNGMIMHQGRGLRRSRLHLPRSRGARLDLRQLRPVVKSARRRSRRQRRVTSSPSADRRPG